VSATIIETQPGCGSANTPGLLTVDEARRRIFEAGPAHRHERTRPAEGIGANLSSACHMLLSPWAWQYTIKRLTRWGNVCSFR
jgi:hypothetical protein